VASATATWSAAMASGSAGVDNSKMGPYRALAQMAYDADIWL
jgi:hypothetical protein